ncbi:MAG: Rpn family recombination-promoting nuclease/putative transposase [Bacteroidales bacterium]|nr:Rpn family recombination-promoting nuclease/putative transposase [Bacteroidales bacterium]
MSKYINPFTDFGFKYIFGNAELLKMFLNALFEKEGKVITKVRYLSKEQTPTEPTDRTIIYDVFCKVDKGDNFILEMQNKYQDTFKDRALYYASRSIVEQGIKGKDWRYKLLPVYGIYFMNFHLNKDVTDNVITDVQLIDAERQHLFCDKLRMIFIDLPAFNKTADECENNLDCWIYNIKNLETMTRAAIQGFDKFYSWAEVAAMPKKKRMQYEESLKNYRDMLMDRETNRNARRRAREEGWEEGHAEGVSIGRAEGILATARNMKAKGLSNDFIAEVTGLSTAEVEKL